MILSQWCVSWGLAIGFKGLGLSVWNRLTIWKIQHPVFSMSGCNHMTWCDLEGKYLVCIWVRVLYGWALLDQSLFTIEICNEIRENERCLLEEQNSQWWTGNEKRWGCVSGTLVMDACILLWYLPDLPGFNLPINFSVLLLIRGLVLKVWFESVV